MEIGVIDLGTNTFHILIAKKEDGGWKEVFRKRIFVELGEEGITTIGARALTRAFDALSAFKKILREKKIEHIQANGTAALRTATNGPAFLKKIKEELNIDISLIDGQTEASLIYRGVRQAIDHWTEPGLIMDIGGGSVEFIIGDAKAIYWSQSFPVGVAVLYQRFHKNDPISDEELKSIRSFFEITFQPLLRKLQDIPCKSLIGASGTFDVLEKLIAVQKPNASSAVFKSEAFHPVFKKLLSSSLAERLNWPNIPEQRATLIIVALVLIDYILSIHPFEEVQISKYAMKEGMIDQLLEKLA